MWSLQASIHYCKNQIRSSLTGALSVGMVQHTTGKFLSMYDKHGCMIIKYIFSSFFKEHFNVG